MNTATPPVEPKSQPAVLVKAAKNPREMFSRALTVLAIAAALTLALWSLFGVWLPLQKKSQELTARASRLSVETDQQERKWPSVRAAQVRADYKAACLRLFSDEASYNEWLRDLHAQAVPLNVDTKVDVGHLVGTDVQDLSIIPATVTLAFIPGSAEAPYQRLLRLTAKLASQSKRVDFSQIMVEGGPQSVSRAVLDFQLWALNKEER